MRGARNSDGNGDGVAVVAGLIRKVANARVPLHSGVHRTEQKLCQVRY